MRIFSPGKVSLNTYNSNGTFTYHNEPEWFVAGSGNASATGNWMLGYRPNGTSEIAMFGGSITAPATVTLDSPMTLGTVKFNSANKYTIAGTSTLTLDSFGEPRITVMQGSHDITAPVVANQNLQMTAIPSNSVLTVSNLSMNGGSAGSLTITTAGAGVVAANNFRAAALNVRSGTARVISNGTAAGTSVVHTLNIAGGTTPPPSSTCATTRSSSITPRRIPARWRRSSADQGRIQRRRRERLDRQRHHALDGNATNFAVGYGEASALTACRRSSARSIRRPSCSAARATGDATLDGTVNLSDFNKLASNFGQTGKVWTDGDFNYDGTINLSDFNLLAGNFGLTPPVRKSRRRIGRILHPPFQNPALADCNGRTACSAGVVDHGSLFVNDAPLPCPWEREKCTSPGLAVPGYFFSRGNAALLM